MGDEIEHARHCFCLASTYAGNFLQPSSLDVNGCLSRAILEPREIVRTLASEGCVAETVSTMLLIAARDQASDPAIKEILSGIVEQEIEHVVLAWKALTWILEQKAIQTQAGVLEAVREVFATPHEHVGFGPIIEEVEAKGSMDDIDARTAFQQRARAAGGSLRSELSMTEISVRQLAEHGYLSIEHREAIASRTLETIVRPLARVFWENGQPLFDTVSNPVS